MDTIDNLISRFVWPDLSTDQGVGRACSIGSVALLLVGLIYVLAFINVFSGSDLIGEGQNEGNLRVLVLCSLAGAVAATVYLAQRIRMWRCRVAAWGGFLWLGYEALNALLAITPNNPGLFLILSFAAFQGVRGSMSSAGTASD